MSDNNLSFLEDLAKSAPGTNFSESILEGLNVSVGDYITTRLRTTWEIVKSADAMLNEDIREFALSRFYDGHLPFSRNSLVQSQRFTPTQIDFYIEAQSHR
jgi:hypothetical protein